MKLGLIIVGVVLAVLAAVLSRDVNIALVAGGVVLVGIGNLVNA